MCPVIGVICCVSLALGEQSVAQLTDFGCPTNGMITRVQHFELEGS
jgi:hypothetical protein